ncbi:MULTISPECIES: hypothetical protein [Parasedimentitalea]|uniref:Uncharacterized protein n=2 Tax=Parasedimentitalea TaxID=2738399 RepID=A0A6L6WKA1_9RHOB|nr:MULTISPECIES: hypothetical protein [Zongyanglinia]KAE9624759.1 hypothetical protein GP644_23155 [Zongyanglinia marina]MVO18256.1 hypothetical protein [Zongyanglinia huanghaiensis]
MTDKPFPYQPGVILYDIIIGLLRARGTTFAAWCKELQIGESSARNALYGQSSGSRGQELRDNVIERAGRDLVERAYFERVNQHACNVAKAMQSRRAS